LKIRYNYEQFSKLGILISFIYLTKIVKGADRNWAHFKKIKKHCYQKMIQIKVLLIDKCSYKKIEIFDGFSIPKNEFEI
jgi:CRISPR/Cas system-associated protein endoribonuclease Cas2